VIHLPIRTLIVLGRVEQVLVQGLPVDGQLLSAGLTDGGDAGGSRNVHHIEGRSGHALGKSQNAVKTEVLGQPIVDLG
jgi:hypothetical protein